MTTRIKLEIYIARPPTQNCRALRAVMEDLVQRYPDEVRLVVFERGVPYQEAPSETLRTLITKGGGVPVSFVNGKPIVVGGRAPTREEVEAKIAEVRREWAQWQSKP